MPGLPRRIGVAQADRLHFLSQEGVNLLLRAADVSAGLQHAVEIEGRECRVVADAIEEVVLGGPVLHPGRGGHRVDPDPLVQVLAVAAGLDRRHEQVLGRHER